MEGRGECRMKNYVILVVVRLRGVEMEVGAREKAITEALGRPFVVGEEEEEGREDKEDLSRVREGGDSLQLGEESEYRLDESPLLLIPSSSTETVLSSSNTSPELHSNPITDIQNYGVSFPSEFSSVSSDFNAQFFKL